MLSFEQSRQRMENVLSELLSQCHMLDDKLHQAVAYSLLSGGKRIRPYLVYASGQMCGAPADKLDMTAAALEAIHCYSLIHDDLPAMDDDELRRGKPTCHIAFDEATAILAGDVLQTLAFDWLSKAPLPADRRLALIQELARAAEAMCSGQSLDMQLTHCDNTSTDQLIHLHQQKTGALIEAALVMGAICANAPQSTITALRHYGRNIGLAFQIHDDILDVTADTHTLGKPAGSDNRQQKSTYPALLGLEGARQRARHCIEEALHALQPLPYNSDHLAAFAHLIINRHY